MNQRGTHNEEYIHVCDWLSTFAHLAGVDPEDPNTVGHRYDGTPFPLPGIDSVNPESTLARPAYAPGLYVGVAILLMLLLDGLRSC